MTKFLDFSVLPTCKVSSRSEKKKGRRRGIIIIIIIIIITRRPSVQGQIESSPSPEPKIDQNCKALCQHLSYKKRAQDKLS